MEGMGLKFTLVLGTRLLRHSGMFGPMAGASGTHSYIVSHFVNILLTFYTLFVDVSVLFHVFLWKLV